jgi:hypothetical protein
VTGLEFVKKLRPFGCAVFLLLGIYFLVFCFTSGSNALPGYVSPHDSSYYSQNSSTLSELKTELETNIFPHLEGISGCEVENGRLAVTIDNGSYYKSRAVILKYYDGSLFDFRKGDS